MYFSRADFREQARYIDSSLESFSTALSRTSVRQSLGERYYPLAAQLENLRPVFISGEEATLPRVEEETIPVIALKPNQSVVLSSSITAQTESQRQKTTDWLNNQGPINDEVTAEFLALLDSASETERVVATAQESAVAATVGTVAILSSSVFGEFFTNSRPDSLVRFYGRTSLLLSMHPGTKRVEPDVFTHELTHVQQKTAEPVSVFHSQNEVDMHALRQELEAYFVGSLITKSTVPTEVMMRILQDPNANQIPYLQVLVEAHRIKYGPGIIGDPFAPTPELLEKIIGMGHGNPINYRLDFNEVLRRATELSS